jgi:hypothetical protein
MLGALVRGIRGRNALAGGVFSRGTDQPPACLIAHLGQRREHHHELHDRHEHDDDAARR